MSRIWADRCAGGSAISVIDSKPLPALNHHPMTNLANLTTSQLNQIIAIKEQIEALQGQIESIADARFVR